MPEKRWKIVVAEPYSEEALDRLREAAGIEQLTSPDERGLRNAVTDCDALLIRTNSRVTRSIIEAAPRLKVIGRGGVGLDNVDLGAASQRGIVVVHTPDAATEAVADLTFGLMLSLLWNLRDCDAGVRAGRFGEVRVAVRPRELATLTLGIIGLGRIGKAVARRAASGFGMHVVYNDIIEHRGLPFEAFPLEKERLFSTSDVVTLHVPLTESTRRLIDTRALAGFKRGAILINTSRGAVVDSLAVAQALGEGRLGGAGLDVFDPEPLPADHPLLAAPRTVFTPHAGARSELAQKRMNDVVEDVLRVLRGEPPKHPAF